MRAVILTLLPFAIACGTKTHIVDKGGDADTTAQADAPDANCMARVLSPISDGQADFYFRDDIAFEINQGADTATITIADADGQQVSGTTWVDTVIHTEGWSRVVFTPEAPLAPSTAHTATLSYCGGSPSVAFSTSSLGTPMETPEEVDGRTFEINLADARITQPSQVAQALLALVDHTLLVHIDNADINGLDLIIGAANKSTGIQDTCMATISVSLAKDLSGDPTFQVGPVDVSFDLAGYAVTLFDATAAATFAADGSYFAGGTMAGTLDARDIVDALAGRDVLPVEEPAAICELITRVGLACIPCTDGEELCLDVEVEDVRGQLSDSAVESIGHFDCHDGCEAACDNEDCAERDTFEVCLEG